MSSNDVGIEFAQNLVVYCREEAFKQINAVVNDHGLLVTGKKSKTGRAIGQGGRTGRHVEKILRPKEITGRTSVFPQFVLVSTMAKKDFTVPSYNLRILNAIARTVTELRTQAGREAEGYKFKPKFGRLTTHEAALLLSMNAAGWKPKRDVVEVQEIYKCWTGETLNNDNLSSELKSLYDEWFVVFQKVFTWITDHSYVSK